MAKAIYETGVAIDGADLAYGLIPDSHFHRMARKLYDAGYRKEDEVCKETAQEVLRILHEIGGCGATEPWEKGFDDAIDAAYRQVAKKYGVILEEDDEQER